MKKQVRKTFLPQDIALLAAIFAAGAACFLLGEGWVGLGVIIIMCGVTMLPFYHHGYRLKGQKGVFRLKELSFPRDYKEEILAFLDGKTEDIDLPPWTKGGVLVDVYWRKSDGFMMARYFDYADFSNGVEYPLREVSEQKVARLESFLSDNK